MKYAEPIREYEDIKKMKDELKKNGTRDYIMFLFGINTGLRISDILRLKVEDVRAKNKIIIKEKKTSKSKIVRIFGDLYDELNDYIKNEDNESYVFKSAKGDNKPISRVQAFRILSEAAKRIGLRASTHSMRKSFGFHHYQQYRDIVLLQHLFNHSSSEITFRYIGVTEDQIDDNLRNFQL